MQKQPVINNNDIRCFEQKSDGVILKMKSQQGNQFRSLYQSLKKQHQNLLQKNQNDLIKIKMRQKQLNEKIAAIKQEKQQIEALLKAEIQILQNRVAELSFNKGSQQQNKRSTPTQVFPQFRQGKSQESTLKLRIAGLQADKEENAKVQANLKAEIISLKLTLQDIKKEYEKGYQNQKQKQRTTKIRQENIVQSKITDLQKKITALSTELQKQKQQRQQLQIQLRKQIEKQQGSKALHQAEINRIIDQKASQAESNAKILRQRLIQTNDALKLELQNKKKLQSLIAIKNQQLKQLEQLYNEVKKPNQKDTEPCHRCEELKQQVELNAEMLKSVRMMLKFKQIQLQSLKK